MTTNQHDKDPVKQAIKQKLSGHEPPPASRSKDEELWGKIHADIAEKATPVRKLLVPYLKYAASILVILSLGVLVYIGLQDETTNPKQVVVAEEGETHPPLSSGTSEETTDETPPAVADVPISRSSQEEIETKTHIHNEIGTKEITLMDGSLVSLKSKTTVRYRQEKGARVAVLKSGEAYFEVKSDKGRPFTVHFGQHGLTVVGTKFNIRNLNNEVPEVTVIEGIVEVYPLDAPDKKVTLSKNQQLVLSSKKNTRKTVEGTHYIAWKTNRLTFSNDNLAYICHILERIHDTTILYEDSSKACKFTGDLSGLPLDKALTLVSLANGISLENRNDKYYLSGTCE